MALLSAYGSDGHKDYFDYQTANATHKNAPAVTATIPQTTSTIRAPRQTSSPVSMPFWAEDCRKENTAVQRLKEKEGEIEIMIEDIKAL